MRADQIKHRFLFVTSTVAAKDTLQVFCWRLLQEGQEVGVMGPTGMDLPEEVPFFTRIPDAVEYTPEVVVPLDEASIRAASNLFGKKTRYLNKDPLAFQMASTRSFGLSLMAKAGLQTVPYHTISNHNDMLRFRAKQAESEHPWGLFPDIPDNNFIHEDGTLGIQLLPGKPVQAAFLVSGKHLCGPAFVYTPLLGLLEKGGIKDFRGMVVTHATSPILDWVGGKVRQAVSAMGAAGFVFVDMLFPEGSKKPLISKISLVPPKGFFAALFLSDLISQPVGQALYSVAKGLKFNWRLKEGAEAAWVHLITDNCPGELPDEPGFYTTSSLEQSYEVGFHVGTSSFVPDSLWEKRPTAEVKLRTEHSAQEFFQSLKELGVHDPHHVTQDPEPEEEEETEDAGLPQREHSHASSTGDV